MLGTAGPGALKMRALGSGHVLTSSKASTCVGSHSASHVPCWGVPLQRVAPAQPCVAPQQGCSCTWGVDDGHTCWPTCLFFDMHYLSLLKPLKEHPWLTRVESILRIWKFKYSLNETIWKQLIYLRFLLSFFLSFFRSFVLSFFLSFFVSFFLPSYYFLFVFERERQRQNKSGRGAERERETQNRKQAPGS